MISGTDIDRIGTSQFERTAGGSCGDADTRRGQGSGTARRAAHGAVLSETDGGDAANSFQGSCTVTKNPCTASPGGTSQRNIEVGEVRR